jgi:hypothetical protein
MIDRFDIQLRQHLLQTADERPAEGQLAAIAAGVAATEQRLPLVARLTWNPGRIGPFPSVALRYGLVAALLVGALVTAALAGSGVLAPKSVFEGTWTSIDPGDGSTQFLTVGAGSHPSVAFVDELATGPACQDDPVKRFVADGTGTVTGSHLDVAFPNGGGCGLVTVPVAGAYAYDTAGDALTDQDAVVWSRVVGGLPQPTVAAIPGEATPEPTPPGPTPRPECTTYPDGGMYSRPVGSMTVSVTLAGGHAWGGWRELFRLEGASCRSGAAARMEAWSPVDTLYADACHWRGNALAIETPADLVAALLKQGGHPTPKRTKSTIGGYRADRLTFSVRAGFDVASCDNDESVGIGDLYLWPGMQLDPGLTASIYVVDVEGSSLAVVVISDTEQADPALMATMDEVLASIHIDAGAASLEVGDRQ